jgi:hypothetical protein
VHTKFPEFVVFWAGASLCLTYLATMLVNSGVIHWGEDGAKIVACLCFIPVLVDLFLLLEYVSAFYEKDD